MTLKRYLQVDKDLNIIKSKPTLKKKPVNLPIVKFVDIGYYILAPLLAGVFLGYALDKKFNSSYFVILGIILGAAGALYNLFRLAR